MPGAGKSTIGVLLAKSLGYDFVDTDLLIQVYARRTLPTIIAEDGFMALREIEATVISALQSSNTVIATGGSAVYSAPSMKRLALLGEIVYLRARRVTLQHRIGDFRARGIAAAPATTLDQLMAERTPLYERYATHSVDADQHSERVVQTVLAALHEI